MLKLFEVKGFKNFQEKITFDFSNVRDYRFNQECISNNLLGKTIVYGRNSIGKTNLGLAIFDIVSHLTTKHVTPGLYDCYLNANSSPELAEFHYVFNFDGDEIDYFYCKDDDKLLISKKLNIKNKFISL